MMIKKVINIPKLDAIGKLIESFRLCQTKQYPFQVFEELYNKLYYLPQIDNDKLLEVQRNETLIVDESTSKISDESDITVNDDSTSISLSDTKDDTKKKKKSTSSTNNSNTARNNSSSNNNAPSKKKFKLSFVPKIQLPESYELLWEKYDHIDSFRIYLQNVDAEIYMNCVLEIKNYQQSLNSEEGADKNQFETIISTYELIYEKLEDKSDESLSELDHLIRLENSCHETLCNHYLDWIKVQKSSRREKEREQKNQT